MELDLNLLEAQFRVFLLVFVRISSVVIAAPVLGSAMLQVAPQLIAFLGASVSLVVMMNLPEGLSAPPFGLEYALRALGEFIIGFSLGFIASLVLAGIQMGGEVIDQLIGFAMADVIDPITNESASLIGNMKTLLMTVLFLMLHGHHHVFRGIMRTFELVPPGGVGLPTQIWPFMAGYAEMVFVVGVQVATPCLLVMTLLWVPEGFLARMVPQLNLLVNDVPLRIMVGLMVIWLGLEPFARLVANLFDTIASLSDRMAMVVAGA